MAKINAKVYIVIIIILIIISSVLAFRTCIPDNGSGFNIIREYYNRITSGAKIIAGILTESIEYIRELENIKQQITIEIEQLEITAEGLRANIIKLDSEIADSIRASEYIGSELFEAWAIISRIRKAGPLESD